LAFVPSTVQGNQAKQMIISQEKGAMVDPFIGGQAQLQDSIRANVVGW